jgi:hypothetical protein
MNAILKIAGISLGVFVVGRCAEGLGRMIARKVRKPATDAQPAAPAAQPAAQPAR